jgi:dsDNA-specific endonuclease/ATPase MutS2
MSEDEPVRIPITDVFDLHSIPPRDARAVVEEYLEEAHALGLKALRIIHGRGIGAQREMVRKVLQSKEYVADFRDAPAEAGGWGATIVTLR